MRFTTKNKASIFVKQIFSQVLINFFLCGRENFCIYIKSWASINMDWNNELYANSQRTEQAGKQFWNDTHAQIHIPLDKFNAIILTGATDCVIIIINK